MGEGGEEKGFSPSALFLFRFHLFPFPSETPDTQASLNQNDKKLWTKSEISF